jgi:hypothetical protein
MEEWKIQFVERPERFGKALYVYRRSHDGRFEVWQSDGKTKVYDGGMDAEPTLFLGGDLFQALIDAIHKDYKPSEGKYTEGKLVATERHLQDLRTLLKLSSHPH